MRLTAALSVLAATTVIASAAVAAAPSATKAALDAGDWRRAAELGASAADVVRALQAKRQFGDAVPDESVVTIWPDNRVDVVTVKPLPALPSDARGARTTGLSGTGFAFAAGPRSIILYPAYAQSFAPQGAARAGFEHDHRPQIP